MTLLSNIRSRISQRAHYLRTVNELRHLPSSIARDLNIAPTDARSIARRAVYGA